MTEGQSPRQARDQRPQLDWSQSRAKVTERDLEPGQTTPGLDEDRRPMALNSGALKRP